MTRLISALLIALVALVPTACGGDDAPEDAAGASSGGGFPVTLQNQLGSVRIPAKPQRVVALDFDSADAAIALGVVPVGMAEVDFAPGKMTPWTRAALDGAKPKLFPYVDGPPLERIAALRPDVILATNTYGLADTYDTLSEIAPVVATQGAEGSDSWQTSTRRIGAALGREAAAERLVRDTERALARARDANPAFEGKTVTFFNLYEGDAWVITKADASIKFLQQLGFVLSPEVARLKGRQGRAEVSPERFDLLDADLVVGTSPAGDVTEALADSPTFQRLAAVRRGAFVGLDLVSATALAFPSALSVQWGVERIVPRLARAVG